MSVAVVLGASRGLGLLCAQQLLARGYRVVISSRSQARCDRARDHLIGRGASPDAVLAWECDVRDASAVAAHLDRVERDVGPIDLGLHVAGVIQVGPWSSWEREQFADAIDTMLWGPIHFALPLARRMTARGRGRIGIVSSVGGLVSAPHLLPYSTAKFGAIGFSQGLASELAGTGVTLTTVAPGLMRVGSHLAAEFAGDRDAEYAWFAAGASAPLLAIDADTAARRIVDGVERGRTFVTFTPLAQLGARVNGLAPGLTTRVLGVVARLLPRASEQQLAATGTTSGARVEAGLSRRRRSVLRGLTALGERAARRNLERD
ncbi:SDR family oxidoreductase [Calidifontibacter sp. DB0510]|uniref:SDR family oxidoreductase n=1 Tax=Metallococcus carri TaxID=1656884 RepID=A0A967AYA6_9MICO|nr:SDR family NAD(P)-dependent oxidoreductase [Metallococcus carri]NHN54654.1 SDR family oxidoreductase [Metallococcus carri]NOP36999.1 SDR family NAD(P)-dependent oxidoreductase [Calidifontibacter sp. DB2511S]